MSEIKTNTQLLKEMQDIADDLQKRKDEVEAILKVIDDLEIRYYQIGETIKKNSKSGG